MTTETLTITAFITARIAEDEAVALAVPPLDHNVDMGGNRHEERFTFGRTLPSSADGMGNWSKHRDSPTTRDHFLRHDPARVLATCKAHRAIVEEHPVSTEYDDEYCMTCQWDVDCDAPKHDYQDGAGTYPCPTLRALASIWSGHDAYDEGWAL